MAARLLCCSQSETSTPPRQERLHCERAFTDGGVHDELQRLCLSRFVREKELPGWERLGLFLRTKRKVIIVAVVYVGFNAGPEMQFTFLQLYVVSPDCVYFHVVGMIAEACVAHVSDM